MLYAADLLAAGWNTSLGDAGFGSHLSIGRSKIPRFLTNGSEAGKS